MSFIEMIHSGILFKNPKPYLKSVQAYFPSVVQCDNGDFVAAAVVGEAFEAVNLRNILFRSKDNGATWELQGPLYEPEPGKPISEACRIAKSKTGELSAFIMRHDRFREDFGLTNPDTLGFVPVTLAMSFSNDHGYTWSKPEPFDPPLIGPAFEMCSPVTYYKDICLLPTSTWPDWDGNCPEGLKMVAFLSYDQGRTWPEYTVVMQRPERRIYFWESKIIPVDSGRLLAVAWAYDDEAGADLENHYAISDDGGKTFGPAMSTGLQGQTLTSIYIEDGRILSAYRRMDKRGLWLNLSVLDGDRWINIDQTPLWGADEDNLTGQGKNMSEKFKELKFGAPHMLKCKDGTILLSFWCVENGLGIIRFCRFKIK
ncbi:MAG: sialidase family protein [Clostridia bacterium]|jgi:sialidase-1